MQMYRVKFAKKIDPDTVDIGDVVVCAGSREAAMDMVAQVLELARSGTEMDVSRVKPSLFQVSRRTVKNSVATFDGNTIRDDVVSVATFPGTTENMPDEFWYSVVASASIRAENEEAAISKIAKAIVREASGEKQKASCKDLDIQCDRTEYHPRSPAVERNALYTFRRIFQGGDTRT